MKKGTGAAYACLMVVFFCWGSVYVANGYILRVLTSTELACCRFVVAAAVLGSVMLVRRMATHGTRGAENRTNGAQVSPKAEPEMARRILPGDWKYLFLIGFLGYYLTMECTVFSVEYAGSSLASLVNSLNPVLISVFAALFLGETLSRRKMICLGVSLVGVYIVSGGAGSGGKATGVLIGIGALIAWAWATVYIRRLSQRIPSLNITFIGVVVSLLFHIPTAAFSILHHGMPVISILQNAAAGSAGAVVGAAAAGTRVLTGKVLLCILYSGAFGTAIPQFLWGFCLSRLPASTCSSFYPMMPVFSAILGVTLLGETLGPSFFIGGALIVAAVIISCLHLERAPQKDAK